jgi:hypothetical protein
VVSGKQGPCRPGCGEQLAAGGGLPVYGLTDSGTECHGHTRQPWLTGMQQKVLLDEGRYIMSILSLI